MIKAMSIGFSQKDHRTVWLKSGRQPLILQEARRPIKKEVIHEPLTTKRIPASNCMAASLHALGGGFFIQDRWVLACRDPKSAVEASQADPGAPSQERWFGLQILLNLATHIARCHCTSISMGAVEC
jgi:hypothetical protein